MAVDVFTTACKTGFKTRTEVKTAVERDPGIQNRLDRNGWTGLMVSLIYKRHSICRWLLSLPGLDANICTGGNYSALDVACMYSTPLDIVIQIARLSSWEIVNKKNSRGQTALDRAVIKCYNITTALYLSWLGVECREENRKYSEVTLQTWIEAGYYQDAQYWAVAANALDALNLLARMEDVTLDRKKLVRLAKLFDHWEIWSYLTSLQSLAWEKVQQSSPALLTLRPAALLELSPPDLHYIVRLLCRYRQDLTEEERSLLELQ